MVAKEPSRKKHTIYLDEPTHTDLLDDLLTALKREHGLPRDNSMLIRALLELARPALDPGNPGQLQQLANACKKNMPLTHSQSGA